ncbi:gfo/Idh/MocA family oxidoreductase [Arenibacter sp. TNZ]|uniref:Gfo/Idh/MocA family protein n=1 Tax=Arenibacter TaxID=178469 RepID=UPI000CD466CF|nr:MULTISPECIES: Gfo/Idh/MocA family oxidoreductase [Arenibacter]MCM4170876.1 gfo/Idh/MocA family oxidoreductase [Arenibacter sp. TNZ]
MERRNFIRKTSLAGASVAMITSSGLLNASCLGANDKIVLAIIGAGGRGRGTIIDTCKVNKNVEIKSVCDVNPVKANKTISQVEKELGYRPNFVKDMKAVFNDKDIDAVWISTPEHWHALATVWACQAGKDVYVEKNPSINIWEGRKMVEAAEKYNRIVQVGFQNRSAPYGFSARDYIKSGKLGKIVHVKSYNMLGGNKWESRANTEVPQGLDWDAWQGPAPYRAYNPGIHDMEERGGWGSFWAYSGGTLADDASHVLDLARMVLGDPGHPKSVYGWGGNNAWGSERETPEFQSITYDFKDYAITCESGNATNYMKKTPVSIRESNSQFPDWRQNATRTEIYGTKGLMYLGRHGGGWQVLGEDGEIQAQEYGIVPDIYHQQDFIASLRERKQPNGSMLEGHKSATLIHLGNIAYRVGNKQLFFDAEKEMFIGSQEANALLRTEYREGYKIPEQI